MDAPEEELRQVHGIGGEIAGAVRSFFDRDENRDAVRRLQESGVVFEKGAVEAADRLAGKTFVLTGTLPTLTRAEARQLIEANGGKLLIEGGTISLQSESAPCDFRKVEIKILK